jgi:hypothetical protein
MPGTRKFVRPFLVLISALPLLLVSRDSSPVAAADAPATNPDPNDYRRYADVKEWAGQINYVYKADWNEQVGQATVSGSQTERGSIFIDCNKIHLTSDGVSWRGSGRVNASFSGTTTTAGKSTSVTRTCSGSGHFENPNNWLEMQFDKKLFRAGSGGATGSDYLVHNTFSNGRPYDDKSRFTPGAARALEDEPLPPPGNGAPLMGSNVVHGNANGRVASILRPSVQHPTLSLEMNWTIAPVWSDIELVVDIDGYEDWIPEGDLLTNGLFPGNRLTAKATLQTKDGKPPQLPAKKIKFELLGTSREPGVCMNWPPEKKSADPVVPYDLRISPSDNPELKVSDETGQTATTQDTQKPTTGSAIIACYDYGAWGDLMVTAELQDGRTIVGHLRNEPSTLRITIPKRMDGSHIADAYRKTSEGSGDAADDTDFDRSPNNSHDGDGFSAYEEYRGFCVNRRHIRTQAAKKDLFILDKIGGEAMRGYKIYEKATGIETHWQIRQDEMRDDRVMNFNRSSQTPVATKQLQHAIIVREWNKAGYSEMESDGKKPCLPKDVNFVSITYRVSPFDGLYRDVTRGDKAESVDESGATIAHEIAHGSCTWHHGESDPGVKYWVRDSSVDPPVIREVGADDDGKMLMDPKDPTKPAAGTIIHVFKERTQKEISAANWRFDDPMVIYVAKFKDGPHSGNEACFMRYDAAGAYTHPRGAANARILFDGREYTGTILCESAAGTGVNASGRSPWPRYGNAAGGTGGAASRGNCKGQININDGSKP